MAPSSYMDRALDKVSISGPILANILQNFTSTYGDCDGLLFGHLNSTMSSKLGDDDQDSGPHEELTAVITGFCCSGSSMGFYDARGRIDPVRVQRFVGERTRRGGDPPIGWFSGRRNTPMRPSIREMAITKHLRLCESISSDGFPSPRPSTADSGIASPRSIRSVIPSSPTRTPSRTVNSPSRQVGMMSASMELDSPGRTVNTDVAMKKEASEGIVYSVGVPASAPCIFMLMTEAGTDQAIHTHDYRVYQYCHSSLEAKTVKVVNIGPAFRGEYDSFSPVSAFPMLKTTMQHNEASDSNSSSTRLRMNKSESPLSKKNSPATMSQDQALLDAYTEGYPVENLANLLNPSGMQQGPELEALYSKMLLKLESLAKQVSDSTSALHKQEKANAQLRSKITGWQQP